MINVTTHIERLDLLREYMDLWIDDRCLKERMNLWQYCHHRAEGRLIFHWYEKNDVVGKTFEQWVEKYEPLETEITYARPSPESYDGARHNSIIMDEASQFQSPIKRTS
jgi:hypothetical protein